MSSSTPRNPRSAYGIWVLDERRQTVACEGLARDEALQRAFAQPLDTWLSSGDRAGLLVPASTGGVIALVWRWPTLVAVLLAESEEETALLEFVATVPFAMATLNHFLTSPHDAITVVDAQGNLRYMSPMHERWLGLRRGQAIGQPAQKVIPNSRMADVASSGVAEIGQPYSADGIATRIVSRIPIVKEGKVVGVIGRTLFKGPEVVQRMYREVSRLQDEVARYRRALGFGPQESEPLARLVGQSVPMQILKQEIQLLAKLDVPVLILGESGTGKELIARALHELSPRVDRRLVSLNLAALPSTLLEAELFGYAPGAFTGGQRSGRIGKFEEADRSTVFFDEVGDIPADMQVKLLRVLEERVIERLGEGRPRKVDFRLIAATHQKMDKLVAEGRFRLDLYYRLAGVTLRVPSLAERLEDLPALVQHFVDQFCLRNNWASPPIEPEVTPYLAQQKWPGNLRQLRQRVEEALVFSSGQPLALRHFERHQAPRETLATAIAPPDAVPAGQVLPLSRVEVLAACQAVSHFKGNKVRAAQALGISRSHLYRLLERAEETRHSVPATWSP